MSAFDAYGKYYDLLNEEKDYDVEAEYVLGLVQRVNPEVRSVLELGCGTGGHAFPLVRRGLDVQGIDLSAAMVERANTRREILSADDAARCDFATADLRDFRAGRGFDAVISLFHVISYQPTNDDLRRAFDTARAHLEAGGAFVFDCWYGPAVLTDPPYVRTREYRSESLQASRTATPELLPNSNLVRVDYDFVISDAEGNEIDRFPEEHWLRYLFLPELAAFLDLAGFEMKDAFNWMTSEPPGKDTWYAVIVAEAV
jgi:SAM-dependent methyltransferase